MNLLRKARNLEARIAGTVDRTVGGLLRSGGREPLEIIHAIVETSRAEVQSSGRGRRIFPFNTITVCILAPSRDARARFEAILADGPSLADRIATQLESTGCVIDALDVAVKYENHSRKNWCGPDFHIEFDRVAKSEEPAPSPDARAPRVEVTVLNGTAEKRTYLLASSARIDIGRCAEVRDDRHRLIRTNHVAFLEGSGDVNQTVSRRHAHVSYEPSSRTFRLQDDGSAHGTSVVRQGRNVAVPRGARGVRLVSGDEVVLGEARVRVRFVGEAPAKAAHA